jgi:uncharacterized integral membrane protein
MSGPTTASSGRRFAPPLMLTVRQHGQSTEGQAKGGDMQSIKLVLLLVLVFTLAAIVLQNQARWQVHFLWLNGEVPGIILLFLAAAAGFIAGITVALLVKRDAKPQH